MRIMNRMQGSVFALSIALISAAGNLAQASESEYPSRYVTIINPFAPGGPTDVVARPLAKILGDIIGKQVVIDNKAGAGGAIAASYVARSQPDGYTLFLATGAPLITTP